MDNKFAYYFTPIHRIVLFLFFIFLCCLPFGIIVELDFIQLPDDPIVTELISETAILLAVVGALFMCFHVIPTIRFRTVFVKRDGTLSGFLIGSLIGLLLILFCGGLLRLIGAVEFSIGHITALMFFAQLFYFVIVALFEELMFRTFPLYVLAERYSLILAIFINSLLFGLVHLSNPNFTWLAMVNITMAGAVFCVFTLQKRNISWAIGIHFMWNFAQGILLGYKISGTDNPGLLVAKPVGNVYLSGGAFGIEGSLICTIVLVSLIVFLWIRKPIKPIVEDIFENELAEELETT